MPILEGALSARRYAVIGEVPDLFRVDYSEALVTRAFREPINATEGASFGWVSAFNLLEHDFDDLNEWLLNEYAVFSLRIDRREAPRMLVRAHLERFKRAWCAANNRPRCPRAIQEELRERIVAELARKSQPKIRVTDVVWNVVGGYVLFGAHADALNSLFREMFRKTFGLTLEPDNPLVWVHGTGSLLTGLSSVFGVEADAADAIEELPRLEELVPEFLTWVWWRTDSGETSFEVEGGPIDVWVEGRVALARREGSGKAVVTGDNAGSAAESRAALAGGKVTEELALVIQQGECRWAFRLGGLYCDLRGAKLPPALHGERDEMISERLSYYEALYDHLRGLFRLYAQARVAPDWEETEAAIAAWAAEAPDTPSPGR